jgi:hypothetical protein
MDIDGATSHVEHLIRQRDQLVLEMEALRNKIAGLDIAIQVISLGPEEAVRLKIRKPRVTETIVTLLRESGEIGLKPMAVIGLAAQRGIDLNRGSVYAMLHRMERAGRIVREDGPYKLKEFARRQERAMIFLTGRPASPDQPALDDRYHET